MRAAINLKDFKLSSDAPFLAAGLAIATATALFAAHMIAQNNGRPRVNAPEQLDIFGKPVTIGYVVAQMSYVIDPEQFAKLDFPPDAYILNEAIGLIYANDKAEYRRMSPMDLQNLRTTLKERVNARLSAPALRDVLIEEFNYVAAERQTR